MALLYKTTIGNS